MVIPRFPLCCPSVWFVAAGAGNLVSVCRGHCQDNIVMVSPPSQAWQGTCACGRENVQAVEVPAQYATVGRTVMVEPPHVVREVIPAQYGSVARTEMVSSARTVWVPADQY